MNDGACLKLKKNFLSIFNSIINNGHLKNDHLFVKEYYWINELVIDICQRLSNEAVLAVIINCCHIVLKHWSKKINDYKDYNYLQYLLKCWHYYRQAVNIIYSMTIYAQNGLSKSMAHPVKEIFSFIFIEHFIQTNNDQILFQSILYTINWVKRKNNSINHLNDLRQIFAWLKYIDTSSTIYFNQFAFPYLNTLKCNYREKSQTMIDDEQFDLINYLHFAEKMINEELLLANCYSFPLVLIRMEAKLLYLELIIKHRNTILDFNRFVTMVDSKCAANLKYFFSIVKYDECLVNEIGNNFDRYINMKLNLIHSEQNSSKSTLADAEKFTFHFVISCLKIFHRCDTIIKESFDINPIIIKSVRASFHSFLNSERKFVCLIALFIHFISMKNQIDKRQNQFELNLNRKDLIEFAFILLSFIEDKKAIVYFVRRFLVQRLLFGLSYCIIDDINLTAERLNSLNIDNNFNVKMLMNDYAKSHYQTTNLKQLIKSDVFLLNEVLWNLDQPDQSFNLPGNFISMFEFFRQYALKTAPKRIIQLNLNYSSATVIGYFGSNNEKAIVLEFIVTMPQLSVLFVFNQFNRCSYDNLKNITGLDPDTLERILKIFITFKLINVINADNNNNSNSSTNELSRCFFEINEQFPNIANVLKNNDHYLEKNLINWMQIQYSNAIGYNIDRLIENYHSANDTSDDNLTKMETGNNVQQYWTVEAAIVRTMKQIVCIESIQLLHEKILSILDQDRFGKIQCIKVFETIIKSLETQGYIRCLNDGSIIYIP